MSTEEQMNNYPYDINNGEEGFDEELPPEAKEYYEYKNQIDIMEKEKKLLESNLVEAKRNTETMKNKS